MFNRFYNSTDREDIKTLIMDMKQAFLELRTIEFDECEESDMVPLCIGCAGKINGVRTDKCGYVKGDLSKCMAQSRHLAELAKAEQEGRLILLTTAPEESHPCDGCQVGWGSASTTGITSCHDTCEKLKSYARRDF